MGSESGGQCCSGGGCGSRWCSVFFKLVLVGLLVCISSSLWGIERAVTRMADSHAPAATSK